MSGCDRDETIGGPHKSQEVCKACGEVWTRTRGGSWDWAYTDCSDCTIKSLPDDLRKVMGDMRASKDQLKAEKGAGHGHLATDHLMKRVKLTEALDALRASVANDLNCHKELIDALEASEARVEELEKEKELLTFQVKLLEEGRKASPNLNTIIESMHVIMNQAMVMNIENFCLTQALQLIASCESQCAGDVVDIAKQALARLRKTPANRTPINWTEKNEKVGE